jgi:hypothetical protein
MRASTGDVGWRSGVRRPLLWLVTHSTGRPRPAVRRHYDRLPFDGLDVAGTKEGGSPPDQEREERSVLRREARHWGQKSPRWSVARRARLRQRRAPRLARRGRCWCASRRSTPSHRTSDLSDVRHESERGGQKVARASGQERRRAPDAANHRGRSVGFRGCLKIESKTRAKTAGAPPPRSGTRPLQSGRSR